MARFISIPAQWLGSTLVQCAITITMASMARFILMLGSTLVRQPTRRIVSNNVRCQNNVPVVLQLSIWWFPDSDWHSTVNCVRRENKCASWIDEYVMLHVGCTWLRTGQCKHNGREKLSKAVKSPWFDVATITSKISLRASPKWKWIWLNGAWSSYFFHIRKRSTSVVTCSYHTLPDARLAHDIVCALLPAECTQKAVGRRQVADKEGIPKCPRKVEGDSPKLFSWCHDWAS